MRCPSLPELPAPPSGKRGWPWTEESERLPETMGDGCPWPRVSIVTPSYNQGRFIEETIRSVLLQGYPNLEYIIIDGGSTDDSVEIIRKYEPWLAYWVSEPDLGQSHAINKGWARATGDAISWLNSDDTLVPGGLAAAVEALYGDPALGLVYGNVHITDAASRVTRVLFGHTFVPELMVVHWQNPVQQQGFLMKRSLLNRVGWLDESMHYCMDFDYWVRIALRDERARYVNKVLGCFRQYAGTKTSTQYKTRIHDLQRIYWKAYCSSDASSSYARRRREAESYVDLKSTYVAYQAEDARLARTYALRHIRNARRRSALLGYYLLFFSYGGRWGMKIARQLHLLGRRLTRSSSSRVMLDQRV